MNTRLMLAAALLAVSGQALADAYTLRYDATVFVDGGPDVYSTDVEQDHFGLDGFARTLSSNPAGDALLGTHFDYAVAAKPAESSGVALHSDWRATADPALERGENTGWIRSYMTNVPQPEGPGRIRFFVDYTAAAAADNALSSAGVRFWAQLTSVDGNGAAVSQRTSFEYDARSAEPASSRSDTWTSDWYTFSGKADVEAADFTLLPIMLSLQTTADFWADSEYGSADAYALAHLRYELAPIPEPETYALTAIGLAALAARRLSRRRAA